MKEKINQTKIFIKNSLNINDDFNLNLFIYINKKKSENNLRGLMIPPITNNSQDLINILRIKNNDNIKKIYLLNDDVINIENYSIAINLNQNKFNVIHTFIHELLHYLQFKFENKNALQIQNYHETELWNEYCKKLEIKTINSATEIIPNSKTYNFINELIS